MCQLNMTQTVIGKNRWIQRHQLAMRNQVQYKAAQQDCINTTTNTGMTKSACKKNAAPKCVANDRISTVRQAAHCTIKAVAAGAELSLGTFLIVKLSKITNGFPTE